MIHGNRYCKPICPYESHENLWEGWGCSKSILQATLDSRRFSRKQYPRLWIEVQSLSECCCYSDEVHANTNHYDSMQQCPEGRLRLAPSKSSLQRAHAFAPTGNRTKQTSILLKRRFEEVSSKSTPGEPFARYSNLRIKSGIGNLDRNGHLLSSLEDWWPYIHVS